MYPTFREFRRLAAVIPLALSITSTVVDAQTLKPFVVTEPVHSMDSVPFYLAVKKGFFKELGLDVQVVTAEGGGRHIAAVIAGDAQAFIGGPEHIAFAKAKGGKDIRAVASMSNRANQYLVAGKGVTVPEGSLKDKLKGKRIAVGTRGGTAHSIYLYLLARDGLDPQNDVTLLEIASSGGRLAAVKAGQADYAGINEPLISQGVKQGIFNPPFLAMPAELGPFAYTTVNVPFDLIQKEPKLVEGLVVGLKKGLELSFTSRADVEAIAKEEFPNIPADDIAAILDRTLKDGLWERTGAMPTEAWANLHKVVRGAGILEKDTPYEAVFYPAFLK
jgi:NitT/TauT family transport system substrate-binding protein